MFSVEFSLTDGILSVLSAVSVWDAPEHSLRRFERATVFPQTHRYLRCKEALTDKSFGVFTVL